MTAKNQNYRLLEIFIHVFCWILFFGFPIIMAQSESGSINWSAFMRFIIVPASLFSIFYINYFILIPKLLFEEHKKKFLISNLIIIIAFSVVIRWWNEMHIQPPPPEMIRHNPPSKIIFIIRDVASMIFSAGLSVAIRLSIRWNETEAARREAVKSMTEAELRNLRNQLNPHFLLNTLNNIYALIAIDSDKAQQAVQELSKLLRYVLYDNQSMYVPLKKEIDFIKNYIELMRIRVSEDVTIETVFKIKENSQTPVAPLIFISLIENAFKHGISPTENSFIKINIEEDDNKIICNIQNSNHPKNVTDKSGSGIGLEQVGKRLQLLYPGQYEWECWLSENDTVYNSHISITPKN
ncbi:sensor histidine kinase [Bacteroides caecigallinarum]|uniref:sensor histidine kinase n=1 Tax=Bacteroides caecigallinarum TaxID=1411144 RepID=UPI00195CF5B3|nr:histidine kinase [Bacteroides caecigallinarum]MBM6882064.1 histidine kinase [Bacteroides caecigallinarum]